MRELWFAFDRACARLDNGRIKCWGQNAYGELGDGDLRSRGSAVGDLGDALPYVDLGLGSSDNFVCVAPPDGLVSSWRGESDATDDTHARDGVAVGGASFTPGEVGQSFLFSNGSYVGAPSAGLPLGASDRTVEAWVRFDALNVNGGEAFIAGYGAFGNGGQAFAIGTTGQRLFFSQWGNDIQGPVLLTGLWTHVAAVSSGSVVGLYVNGMKVNEAPFFMDTQPGDFAIGSIPGDAYRQLNGAVDDVAIYDRALSPAEIASLFHAGSAGKCH